MGYYTIRKIFFVDCYTSNVEQSQKIDKFLELLDKSGVCDLLNSLIKEKQKNDTDKGGRPTHNPYNMLALILFNFSFGKGTLRDIEDSCKYDLRCIYIMQNERPSHMTLSNFINDYILPNTGKFFSLITKTIFDECNLKMERMYLDGSKFEANANKYKFVWKPTKFHLKLCDKVRDLLSEYNLTRGLNKSGIISSQDIANKVIELNNFLATYDLTIKENKKTYKKL